MSNIITPRREDMFDINGAPTRVFMNWVELISEQSNNTTVKVDDSFRASAMTAYEQWLQKQIDGLPEFTVDTSGYTTDLSYITTDKAIA